MANLDMEKDVSGIFRSYSDSPPTHFSVEIQFFSLLAEEYVETGYVTKEFDAEGYQWKLVFYPNGNKKRNVENHISLYLVKAGVDSLDSSWEVYVDFRLFLLDQNSGKYLVFEDAFTRKKCFHGAMRSAGFDKLVSQKDFNDISNGYLVDDTCVFGAEVFVCKERRIGKRQCLERVISASTYKHVWKVEKFSLLGDKSYRSEPFNVSGHNWKIKLYPKGHADGRGSHMSMFLELSKPITLPPGSELFAKYKLSIMDQTAQRNHKSSCSKRWFNASKRYWGQQKFLRQETLQQADRGFLKDDACLLEAEVTVLGISKLV